MPRIPRLGLHHLRFIDKALPLALVTASVVSARFLESELTVFLVLLATVAIYAWRRYDANTMVAVALILLMGCATLFLIGAENYASKLTFWAYYFVVLGVFGLLITERKEKKEKVKRFRKWFEHLQDLWST